jgi:hypothetical protein
LSVLLLAPTVLNVWKDGKCGPLCAMLLVLGWTFSAVNGVMCVALALILWLLRGHLSDRSAQYLRWAAVVLGIVVLGWLVASSWNMTFAPTGESGRENAAIMRIRNIMGLEVSAVIVLWLLLRCIRSTHSVGVLTLVSALFALGSALVLPGSFKERDPDGTAAKIREFADWRKVIPPTATVFVAPARSSATLAWFTLERPSYLTQDQSAGVIYSRATATEVKRRSQVLLPILDPDWRILTRMNNASSAGRHIKSPPPKPLTKKSLISVCGDLALDFVIAKENVGFDPIPHTHAGDWMNWNLYDCRRVRSQAPAPAS